MTSTATPSSPSVGTTGIVLFAHGSRDPLWRLPMDAVAQRITALNPAARVVCAFLELTTPDLPSAVAEAEISSASPVILASAPPIIPLRRQLSPTAVMAAAAAPAPAAGAAATMAAPTAIPIAV